MRPPGIATQSQPGSEGGAGPLALVRCTAQVPLQAGHGCSQARTYHGGWDWLSQAATRAVPPAWNVKSMLGMQVCPGATHVNPFRSLGGSLGRHYDPD